MECAHELCLFDFVELLCFGDGSEYNGLVLFKKGNDLTEINDFNHVESNDLTVINDFDLV